MFRQRLKQVTFKPRHRFEYCELYRPKLIFRGACWSNFPLFGYALTRYAEITHQNPRMHELLRPWKLVTLTIGLGLLVVGSIVYQAPDWDIPVSILMALVAYVTAPWCMRIMLERRWRLWPVMLFLTWFGVDGCYAAYWSLVNPAALASMREANAPASLSLFWTVGLLWMYKGSLSTLAQQAAAIVRGRPGRVGGERP